MRGICRESGRFREQPARAVLASEFAGGDAEDLAEVGGEVALVAEADFEGDLGGGFGGGEEEFAGTFDAAPNEVLVGGEAGGALEEPGEVEGAEAAVGGELADGDVVGQAGLEKVDGLAELGAAEAAVGGSGEGTAFGMAGDEMGGEGGGERFAVGGTGRTAILDFAVEGHDQAVHERIVHGDPWDQVDRIGAAGQVVSGQADELGIEGDGHDLTAVKGAAGEWEKGGDEDDLAREEADGAVMAIVAPFEDGGSLDLGDEDMFEGRDVGDVLAPASGVMFEEQAGPRSGATGEQRGLGDGGAAGAVGQFHEGQAPVRTRCGGLLWEVDDSLHLWSE